MIDNLTSVCPLLILMGQLKVWQIIHMARPKYKWHFLRDEINENRVRIHSNFILLCDLLGKVLPIIIIDPRSKKHILSVAPIAFELRTLNYFCNGRNPRQCRSDKFIFVDIKKVAGPLDFRRKVLHNCKLLAFWLGIYNIDQITHN